MARRRRVWRLEGLDGISIPRSRGRAEVYFLSGALVTLASLERAFGWIPAATLYWFCLRMLFIRAEIRRSPRFADRWQRLLPRLLTFIQAALPRLASMCWKLVTSACCAMLRLGTTGVCGLGC